MSQQKKTTRAGTGATREWVLPSRDGAPTGLLIIAASEPERCRWAQRTEGLCAAPHSATSTAEAIDEATRSAVSLALVSNDHAQRAEIIAALKRIGVGSVVVACEATLDRALQAMRDGASDLITERMDEAECAQRIVAAAHRDAAGRAPVQERRLEEVCRTLNQARHEVTQQVGTMCDDLVAAYEQITKEIDRVRLSSEFGAIVRQELDIEDLLRTVLQFMLAKIGTTNTAVYLPASAGDYSLSAYVNYDCPRESGEQMMEHLADVVPAALEYREGVVVMETAEQFEETLGGQGRWLEDYAAAGFACRDDDGECLAVVFMFRDRHTGFNASVCETLKTIAPVFGEQLARIVRVHNRHTQLDDELMFGAEEDDELPEGPFGFDDDLDWDDGIDLAA